MEKISYVFTLRDNESLHVRGRMDISDNAYVVETERHYDGGTDTVNYVIPKENVLYYTWTN